MLRPDKGFRRLYLHWAVLRTRSLFDLQWLELLRLVLCLEPALSQADLAILGVRSSFNLLEVYMFA